MANPLSTSTNIQSNILAYEELQPYGFCRLQQEVDNTAGTMKLGSVLARTLGADKETAGAWTEVTATTLTDGTYDQPIDGSTFEFAVIIGTDNRGGAFDTAGDDITTTGTDEVLLLVRGTAIVRRQYLVYQGAPSGAADSALKALVEGYMEQVVVAESQDQFDGTYSDVTPITN